MSQPVNIANATGENMNTRLPRAVLQPVNIASGRNMNTRLPRSVSQPVDTQLCGSYT